MENTVLPALAAVASGRDTLPANETLLPPALAAIASGRDHVTTAEFARATSKEPQTVRKNYCLTGECFGIKPVKVGNDLLWPVAEISALLQGVKK